MLSENFLKIRAWIVLGIALVLYPIIIIGAVFSVLVKSVGRSRKSVAGEVALITGSANGLGKEIAIGLAARGCHIAVVDIDEEAAIKTARQISKSYSVMAKPFKVDITQYDEVKALAKNVEDQLGPVSILVNNAGIMTFSSFYNPPPAEIQNMINTNLTAQIWTVRIFLESMRKHRKGHIVAISSMAGVIMCPRNLEYTATKFAVRGYMDALRSELDTTDCEFIRTTTVFPFFTKTNSKVTDIFQTIGVNDIYPSISGEEAGKATVEGILINQLEVHIPGLTALAYRLFEGLPKEWQAHIIAHGPISHVLKKFKY